MKKLKLIVALDFNDWSKAIDFACKYLNPEKHLIKIGHKLFTGRFRQTHSGLNELSLLGFKIFLDLKLFEIPSIVGDAIRSLCEYSNFIPWAITVHSSAESKMISYAVEAARDYNTKILGVTVLTTNTNSGISIKDINNCLFAKIDGFVCPSKEILTLKEHFSYFEYDPIIVVPGIRPANHIIDSDDQEQIGTPKQAISNGADYIVVGRPIIENRYPDKIIKEIEMEIS